ncbi:expressed unknown protein [Seminavis robusta]|uniref:Uncharacterized protein n=1 Tax=Seminavis robusta TaxID=568900 RepID=A0A9N8I0I3_9STRA|nr:expressed unknown protein [Seminavis robusta]|eukprot:Sro3948_g352100.1 n/a (344) ;mRNA; r:2517-3548
MTGAATAVQVPVALYRVDHSARVTGGGLLSPPLRHLMRWVFGISDPVAIARGLRGAACRGEEHELIIYWDQATTSYEAWYDGHPMNLDEIQCDNYSSKDSVEFIFEVDGLPMRVTLVTVDRFKGPSLLRSNDTSSFKYELEIDGRRFLDLIKIYQLGMSELEVYEDAARCARNLRDSSTKDEARVVKTGGCIGSTFRMAKGMLKPVWSTSEKEIAASSTGHRTWETLITHDMLMAEQEDRMLRLAMKRSLKETRQPWWDTAGRRTKAAWKRMTAKHFIWLVLAVWLFCHVVLVVWIGFQQKLVPLIQHLYASFVIFAAIVYVPKLLQFSSGQETSSRQEEGSS